MYSYPIYWIWISIRAIKIFIILRTIKIIKVVNKNLIIFINMLGRLVKVIKNSGRMFAKPEMLLKENLDFKVVLFVKMLLNLVKFVLLSIKWYLQWRIRVWLKIYKALLWLMYNVTLQSLIFLISIFAILPESNL
mgnify:FL=1|jgi:hypothetical protein